MVLLTSKITWMLYIAALGYWARSVKRKTYPNFLAERVEEISELRVRVRMRPRCES